MPRLRSLGSPVKLADIRTAPGLTTRAARLIPGSAEERALKRAIARRSGGFCECSTCRQSARPLPAQEFDHIVPLWEGGGHELGNWQHLNAECHKRKTSAEHRRRLGLDPLPGG